MADSEIGFIGRIPVKNLWFLMFYAAGLAREIGAARRSVAENPEDIPDLVAGLLSHRVELWLHRNLGRGFRRREAVLGRVRGRILLLETETRRLLSRGKLACRFDELTIDTPRNRFIRSALESLSHIVQEGPIARKCRSLGAMLRKVGVIGENPGIRGMSNEVFGRNDAIEKPMVELARLAFKMAILTEEAGAIALPVPDREEIWARKLFEKGIAGFYSAVLPESEWMVEAGKRLAWKIDLMTPDICAYLPVMITDIIVQKIKSSRKIIIDTKFTEVLKRERFGKERLRSGYVYQMYSYLRSQEQAGDAGSLASEGLLLHPSIGYEFDEGVVIQGHYIRFATVDLSGPIQDIRDRLLEVIEEKTTADSPADDRTGYHAKFP